MGVRSNFPRRANDAYDTPAAAVEPLLAFLPPAVWYGEPCAGRGDLVGHLACHGHYCVHACDIEPRNERILRGDILDVDIEARFKAAALYITNPPWSRPLLHPIIERLSAHRPTWLLLDSNWANTRQAAPHMRHCRAIVAVGRVKWIEGSPHAGKDDAAWYLFDAHGVGGPVFVGRR